MELISWLDDLAAKVAEALPATEGKGVKIEKGPGGVVVHAVAEAQSANAQSAAQSFPFKTVKGEEAGSVLVMGRNEAKGRSFRNLATLGLSVLEVPETSLSGIATDSYVYLSIKNESGNWNLELKTAASLPEQSASEYAVPIAYVETQDGAISKISQLQYGPLQGAGRIF